jgi:hypothetical protein
VCARAHHFSGDFADVVHAALLEIDLVAHHDQRHRFALVFLLDRVVSSCVHGRVSKKERRKREKKKEERRKKEKKEEEESSPWAPCWGSFPVVRRKLSSHPPRQSKLYLFVTSNTCWRPPGS